MHADVVAATIAQAGAIGNQGGGGGGGGGGGRGWSSNLQRLEANDPPTFKGGGDPMVAGHCFRLVGKDTSAAVAIITQASVVAATNAQTSATMG